MRKSLVLLTTTASLWAGAALAQEQPASSTTDVSTSDTGATAPNTAPTAVQPTDSSTLNVKLASGYILPDDGIANASEPVIQASYLWTHGKWTFGPWASYGSQQFAKEFDIWSFYDTKVGPVAVELSAQDYFLNGKGGMLNLRNNLVDLYVDASVPKTFGPVTVAPLVRAIQEVGFGNFPSQTIMEAGVRGEIDFSDKFRVTADVRESFILTNHTEHALYDVNATYKINNKIDVGVEFQGTSATETVFAVNLVRHF